MRAWMLQLAMCKAPSPPTSPCVRGCFALFADCPNRDVPLSMRAWMLRLLFRITPNCLPPCPCVRGCFLVNIAADCREVPLSMRAWMLRRYGTLREASKTPVHACVDASLALNAETFSRVPCPCVRGCFVMAFFH